MTGAKIHGTTAAGPKPKGGWSRRPSIALSLGPPLSRPPPLFHLPSSHTKLCLMDTLAFFSFSVLSWRRWPWFFMPCFFYPALDTRAARCWLLAWSFGAPKLFLPAQGDASSVPCGCVLATKTTKTCRPNQALDMPNALWPGFIQHSHHPGIRPQTRGSPTCDDHQAPKPATRRKRWTARASERGRRPIVSWLPGRRHAAAKV